MWTNSKPSAFYSGQINPGLLLREHSLNKLCQWKYAYLCSVTSPGNCSIPFNKRKTVTWAIIKRVQETSNELLRGIFQLSITAEQIQYIFRSIYKKKKKHTFQYSCITWDIFNPTEYLQKGIKSKSLGHYGKKTKLL